MNKIKLLVALPNHELPPRENTPGIGTLIHRQLQAMDQERFEITSLCNATDAGTPTDHVKYKSVILPTNKALFGFIRILPERIRQSLFGIGSSLKSYRCLRIFFWILIRCYKFDAVVLHNYTAPAVWLIRLKKVLRFRTKIIYYFHSSGIDQLFAKHKQFIEADGIITISGEESRLLDQVRHVNIINNYCRKFTDGNRKNYDTDNNKPLRIVSSSNIDENKGIDIIIDSMEILQTNKLNIELDLYGAVKNNSYFEGIKLKLSKLSCVNYAGYIANEKLLLKLPAYDLSILLSQQFEGNGMSIIESLIEGHIPAIGSNIGGIPLVMNNGKFGFLINEYSKPYELAELLMNLNSNRALISEKKQNILKEADSYFSPQKSAKILTSFLQEIIK